MVVSTKRCRRASRRASCRPARRAAPTWEKQLRDSRAAPNGVADQRLVISRACLIPLPFTLVGTVAGAASYRTVVEPALRPGLERAMRLTRVLSLLHLAQERPLNVGALGRLLKREAVVVPDGVGTWTAQRDLPPPRCRAVLQVETPRQAGPVCWKYQAVRKDIGTLVEPTWPRGRGVGEPGLLGVPTGSGPRIGPARWYIVVIREPANTRF